MDATTPTDRTACTKRWMIALIVLAGIIALGGCEKIPPEFDGLVSAVGSHQAVTLAWDAAVDPSEPISYKIYMAETSGGQNFGTPDFSTRDLGYEVTGLSNGTEYFFVVRARDLLGNEEDNLVELSAVPLSFECNYTEAERLAWTFTSPGPDHIRSLARTGDMDGDDVADILVETDSFNLGDEDDHLFLLSGAPDRGGEAIWSASPSNGTADSAGWGDECIESVADLNGDGLDDVLLGTAWGNRSAYAVDGLTGDTIWFYDTHAQAGGGWIYDVGSMPDITGDTVPEVMFCAGSDTDMGYLADGATGDILWTLYGSNDALFAATGIPDVDADSVPDVIFAGGDTYESRIFCVSGASHGSGDLVWDYDTGASNHTLAVIKDVDGDSVHDVVVGPWGAGLVCVCGADGSFVWSYSMTMIMRIALLDDVDGDWTQDVAVGSWDNAALVVSGLDGTLVWRTEVGTENGGDIWTVDGVGDINGDGVNDVVGGSFDTKVYAFDGVGGDILWSFDTGGSRVYSVRGVPDVTGDRVPDIVAGTQALGAEGEGTVYLLEGCP